jgi:REP element-mobilizing transposase RayT
MIIVIEAMGGRMISAPTLSKIIAYFKQFVSRKVGYSPWQRSFYDHIIRDEEDYLRIVEYIENNPLKWELDLLYVEE